MAAVRTRAGEVPRAPRVPLHPASPAGGQAEQEAADRLGVAPGPSRKTKDGSFLTTLVQEGLLARVTGSAHAPCEATYALTERGKYAAGYGEYELKPGAAEPQVVADAVPPKVQTLREGAGKLFRRRR